MGNNKSKNKGNEQIIEEPIVSTNVKSDKSAPGMIKPKKYDWKDSNIELIGSKLDKDVKKSSAETEGAWKAAKAATKPSIFVWRIEKFTVAEWPKEDYGKFYSGDSYIILRITKEENSPELFYDAHFWIGKRSTQDEYGTAAYKTVELDTLLDDKAVQHREVQGFESDKFKSYFPVITIMKGGCASGFRHVEPTEYKPRLLLFRCTDRKNVRAEEIKFTKKALDSGDVFILDNGLEAFQWNGKLSNKNEKVKAAQFLQELESERNGRCKSEVLDEEDTPSTHQFYKLLPDVPFTKKVTEHVAVTKALYRLSDESGKMVVSLVSEGTAPKAMLKDNDVYMIDNGKHMFVYIGKGASKDEKKHAMTYAHNYLKDSNHPLIGITCLQSGQHSKELEQILD